MKYCEQCGTELADNAEFCSECGAKCEDSTSKEFEEELLAVSDEPDNKKVEKRGEARKGKKALFIIIVLIIMVSIVGYFVIYPKVTDYLQNKENQREAQKVINLIDSLRDKEITASSEEDLDKIRLEYDSLSTEQKKLVSNYSDLENAYKNVEKAKDQKTAGEMISAIDKIDKNSLTASDTSVKDLRDKYNNLSESQKALITNANKLDEYEQVVQDKRAETEQQSTILEMFDNLIFYEGLWGDFGSHVNEYQGMVENAIKSSISLSDYFGDANGTYMILEKRVMNDDVLANGLTAQNQIYTIMFQGPSVTGTGGARTLECTVSSPDGVNLVYNEDLYY